jgi:hypothetical protein
MRRAFVVASTVVLWFAGVEPAFAQSGPFQKVCVDVVMKSWSAPDPDPEGTVRTNGPTSSPTSKPPPEPEPKRAAPISFAQAGAPRALFAAPRDAWAAPNTPTTAEDSKPAATDATTDAPPIAVELEEALSDAEQEPAKPSVDLRSREVRPELYLKRLIEYEVTHHALLSALRYEQKQSDEAGESVDYLYSLPADVGEALTGFRHDGDTKLSKRCIRLEQDESEPN